MSERAGIKAACGHDATSFGPPMCTHLLDVQDGSISMVRWYTGTDLENELLCEDCAKQRRDGTVVRTASPCESCHRRITEDLGYVTGAGGMPGIRTRPEPFPPLLRESPVPASIGDVSDIAPIDGSMRSAWIILNAEGGLFRFDAVSEVADRLGTTALPAEPSRQPWGGHRMQRHLQVAARGDFAAVVNDFGRWGELVDLRSGERTLALDGDDYHCETVPFSFAFADLGGHTVAIHRTAWNRLDMSDPATGAVLTDRGPTELRQDERRPEHYLDYFHGALIVSPGSAFVADDGWIWHPVGVPCAWSLSAWSESVWESEDGRSRVDLGGSDYFWNRPMAWLDDRRLAIGGIGEDDNEMVDGARVFDVLERMTPGPRWRPDWQWARELARFPGPAGTFFSDGCWLYSSDETGLSRWDFGTGERTGHLPDFHPTRHHRGARELVELRDGVLLRLSI